MIDIQLDDREVREALQRLQRRLGDLTPVMRDIGELLTERAKQRFEASTGPDGQKWAPNAPATVAAYLKQYGGSYKKSGVPKGFGHPLQPVSARKPSIVVLPKRRPQATTLKRRALPKIRTWLG